MRNIRQVARGLRLSFAADSPDIYSNMNRKERDARRMYGSDQYTIDQKGFFIREENDHRLAA